MLKTFAEQSLEASKGMTIKDILLEAFARYTGQTQIVNKVSAELGVSAPTIYSWCDKHGINVEDYK